MGRKPRSDTLQSSVSQFPLLTLVGSGKGGVGKSFAAALAVDLFEIAGHAARIVQVDEQERLTRLYPDRVDTVALPGVDDLRRDPSAIVAAFDPLFSAVERAAGDRRPLVVDIGGPQQAAFEQYCAVTDLDEELVAGNVGAAFLIPATAEPEAMRAAAATARSIGRVLPSARRTILLNGRDGAFHFYPGSPADRLWCEDLQPLCREIGSIKLPAIAAGSWVPFETAGKRLLDVVAADVDDIRAWTGRSRPVAKILRGDVASFMATADATLGRLLGLNEGGGHGE